MKKDYMKPAMRVVKTQPHHIICTSPYSASAKGISTNSESGITWKEGGFDDEDGDY